MSTTLRGRPARGGRAPVRGGQRADSGLPASADHSERELRQQLGLADATTLDDAAAAHDEIVRFLAKAPRSLRTWARTQAAAADEALTLLSDPTAPSAPSALLEVPVPTGSQPGGSATPPAHRAIHPPDEAPVEDEAPSPSEDEFEALLAEVTPSMHRDAVGAGRPVSRGPRPFGSARSWLPDRRRVVPAIVLVGAVAIGFGGYQLGADGIDGPGRNPGAGDPAATNAAATPAIDAARVTELMGRIQANASDAAALMDLGDEYYRAGDYQTAATWFERLVTLDAGDIRARLALGAARFNIGDLDAAKAQWEEVLDRDPGNVEANYDLGFLYLNQEPPDLAAVERAWREVIRLAPDSEIAATVKAHLDALEASASGDPSGAPEGGSPAAPSPASSPAPPASPSAPSAGPGGAP